MYQVADRFGFTAIKICFGLGEPLAATSKYHMQTVCVCYGALAATDECLIISTPAVHSKKSIIKAWGYVLIILLNSDEILKRSP